MKINIIAAIAQNNAIGKDNKLLWHIKDDLQLFKKTTLNHVIIMGRKSYESIGRPLPKRTNVVVTRKRDYQPEGVLVFNSLNEVFDHFDKKGEEDVYVIGGGEIYRQSLDDAHVLHISHVDVSIEDADTFFPNTKWDQWEVTHEESYEASDVNDYGFTYKQYVKRPE